MSFYKTAKEFSGAVDEEYRLLAQAAEGGMETVLPVLAKVGITRCKGGWHIDWLKYDQAVNVSQPEPQTSEFELGPPMGAGEILTADIPELDYIIKNALVRPGLTVIGGYAKMGKSLLCNQLATTSVKAGPLFPDYELAFQIEKPLKTLYLAYEDRIRRIKGRLRRQGIVTPETAWPKYYFNDQLPPLFIAEESLRGDITKNLNAILSNLDEMPDQIIIDAFISSIIGVEENKASVMAPLWYELREFAHDNDIVLTVVHHTRKAQGKPDILRDLRGSGAIAGGLETAWGLYETSTRYTYLLQITGNDIDDNLWIIK